MKVGNKSLIFGVHAFWLHWIFVAYAWIKLYGFPKKLPIWVAFIVHDFGYWGKDKLDDELGETHPKLGAKIMTILFDFWGKEEDVLILDGFTYGKWGKFSLLHSRHYANRLGLPFSQLCVADKLAFVLTPKWIYLPMATLTGEVLEYMENAKKIEHSKWNFCSSDKEEWHKNLKSKMIRWVEEHKYHTTDTWLLKD